ncbi:MAG: DoxX family protein [Variovorax sp.]|jgi:putative oxidoreductase|nr:MAG: DoxX family protein [Variovorax sp.]
MATTLSASRSTGVTTTSSRDVVALVARLLIAALFIPAGFGKLMNFAGTVGYITSAGLPLPQVAAAIAIVVELGLGVLFLVGFKTRWVALALAVFTVAASFGFHHYWSMPADKVMVNQLMFFKNLAIAGGLLAFWSFGPGRLSVDER